MLHRHSVFTTALIATLLALACDRNPASVNELPDCDPVQPRPPCTPKSNDPSLVRTLQIVDGDTQIANVGSALTKPLTVRVADRAGAPLPNVSVKWVSEAGASVASENSMTDANGVARVQVTLGPGAGAFAIDATVASYPTATVRFLVVAEVAGAFRVESLTGNVPGQSDTVFSRLAQPYTVKVTNYKGAPVPGVTVTWQLNGSGALSATTTATDANGTAQVTHTLGSRVTAEVAQAFVTGVLGSPATFVTSVKPGRTVSLAYVTGDKQVGLVATEAPNPYVVRTTDAYGNSTEGQVEWSVISGGGTLRVINGVTVMHRFGPFPGQQVVSARLAGVSGEVSFTSNAVNVFIGVGDPYCYGELGFYPKEVILPAGGVAAWVWYDSWYCTMAHAVVFEDDPDTVAPRTEPFTRMFAVPGTYRYRCKLHSINFAVGEVGVITVQ